VTAALATVSLGDTAGRLASQLSGGQQQRLALARAIISHPRVLLLDEPLSNLDVKLREQLRVELKRIQREVGVTTIYVTHDQAEALSLSDRLAVMDKGRFVQVGPPREIYRRPATRAVAQFIGLSNLIPATALPQDGSAHRRFTTPLGPLDVAGSFAGSVGSGVTLTVRPECVRLVAPGTRMPNTTQARVTLTMFYGDHQDVQVIAGGLTILVRTIGGPELNVGDDVGVSIDPADIAVSPASN
jgi:iron(III) transport system ATP-binding protein